MVLNQFCAVHCLPHYLRDSSFKGRTESTTRRPPLLLARRRQCHADECRHYNFKFPPYDWQCYPLSALTPDRRLVMEWATTNVSSALAESIRPGADVEEAAMAALEAADLTGMSRGFCGPLSLPGTRNWAQLAGTRPPLHRANPEASV